MAVLAEMQNGRQFRFFPFAPAQNGISSSAPVFNRGVFFRASACGSRLRPLIATRPICEPAYEAFAALAASCSGAHKAFGGAASLAVLPNTPRTALPSPIRFRQAGFLFFKCCQVFSFRVCMTHSCSLCSTYHLQSLRESRKKSLPLKEGNPAIYFRDPAPWELIGLRHRPQG